MTSTRRDLIKLAGGAAVGALFTPAPWRLLTDTALWSETWPGVPRPATGEIRTRYTNCSLCTAGCAVRARCVGDQPVALMGVSEHPFTRGALCPFGLAGHQLPYHPQRVKQAAPKDAADAVASAIAACKPGERVAVLDLRPGRTASWTYRRSLAKLPNGTYLAPTSAFGGPVALDLAAAKTVVSFGVPLLDGWGTPGNVLPARQNFRLIQAETVESRTAAMADTWLPTAPDAEIATAESLARQVAAEGPALILDARERPEILALNRETGALGTIIVSRAETPVPESWKSAVPATALADLPDAS